MKARQIIRLFYLHSLLTSLVCFPAFASENSCSLEEVSLSYSKSISEQWIYKGKITIYDEVYDPVFANIFVNEARENEVRIDYAFCLRGLCLSGISIQSNNEEPVIIVHINYFNFEDYTDIGERALIKSTSRICYFRSKGDIPQKSLENSISDVTKQVHNLFSYYHEGKYIKTTIEDVDKEK